MDDGWLATRQALAGAAVIYLRLRAGAGVAEPSVACADEVHVALLGLHGAARTLCGFPADSDLTELVGVLGARPCLGCVARAAELACLVGIGRC
jgi:hypothetical protein